MTFCGSLKLAPRFFGPYEILAKVGPVAYRLALPSGSQIHDVFHVSLLQQDLGHKPQATPTLPLISGDSTVLPAPELILDLRIIQKGKYRPKTEVLVKWIGAPTEDATWENLWHFSKPYPKFILVDKDNQSGGE